MPSYRGSSWPRDRTSVSRVSCIRDRFFTHWATWEAPMECSVQSLSRVRLFATPWIAARQASLSIANSRSSLKLMSIESVMPSSHLILCTPFSSCPQSLPASGSFPVSCYSAIKRNTFESVLRKWMNLEPIIQSEVSQREKDKYRELTHTSPRKVVLTILHAGQQRKHRHKEQTFGLSGRRRGGDDLRD